MFARGLLTSVHLFFGLIKKSSILGGCCCFGSNFFADSWVKSMSVTATWCLCLFLIWFLLHSYGGGDRQHQTSAVEASVRSPQWRSVRCSMAWMVGRGSIVMEVALVIIQLSNDGMFPELNQPANWGYPHFRRQQEIILSSTMWGPLVISLFITSSNYI